MPYPFLGRCDLVKGEGKARKKMAWGPGNRVPVQEDSKWTPGSQPCSSPESSPFTVALEGEGIGGDSQERKVELGH